MGNKCTQSSKRAPRVTKIKLENVAINDVLSLKAARCDPSANLNVFGARDTSDPISMVAFTFTMRRYLIRLVSAPLSSFRLAKFGRPRLLTSVCDA